MGPCLFGVVLFLGLFAKSYEKKLPPFIKRCNYSTDGEVLGECIKNVFNGLKDKFMEGIPEMHVPTLDPFEINEIDFNTGGGSSIGLESRFSDVKIMGIKSVVLEKVNIDIQNNLCTVQVYFPTLSIASRYRLTGKIMIIQLNGTGRADGNFSDIRSTVNYKGHYVTRHNKQYVEWTDRQLQLTIGKAYLHFSDLFKDNKELTETTNHLINENYEEIMREVKPLLEETILTITFTVFQRVFHTFSLNELFIR